MPVQTRIANPATDTNFSSGPATGDPTKVQPSSGAEAQGFVPGASLRAPHLNYYLDNHADALNALYAEAFFGNGRDGAIVEAGTRTLSEDLHCTTLTVQSGGTVHCNGYRIFAQTSITVDAGGVIDCDGNAGMAAGSGGAGGTSRAAGTLTGTAAGGAQGGPGMDGNPGGAVTNSLGAAGGAGGASSGAETGGAAGARTRPTTANGRVGTDTLRNNVASALQAIQGRALDGTLYTGGSSGGGGAATGGGGGASGGVMLLASPTIVNNGAIHSRGGAGGNGNGSGGSGGGGGGGAIIVVTRFGLTGSGTWDCNGGAAGTPGAGVAGSAGSATAGTIPLPHYV